MRHGRIVTGTQKTRALRLAVALLLSIDVVFYVVMAIGGAVNVSRLDSATYPVSQMTFFNSVRSVATMQATVGFVALIVLVYPIFWSWQSSKRSADVQRSSGSPFQRLAAFGGLMFASLSTVIIVAYTLEKPQSFCTTSDSQSCLWLMQQPLIRPSTVCGLLGSILLMATAVLCSMKPRVARQQPARYLQRLPASWPDTLQYRSGSLRSTTSTVSGRSISSRSPSHYKANVYHYHKRQVASNVSFNTYNPFDEKRRSTSDTPDMTNTAFVRHIATINMVDYKANDDRITTPDLEHQRESSSPTPPSSPSSYTCETPPDRIVRLPSQESLSAEAKGQRVKRKAVEYTERSAGQRRHSEIIDQTTDDFATATFVRLFHNNASLDSMTDFYDAASTLDEPIIAMQQRRNKRPAPRPPRPPKARTTSLKRDYDSEAMSWTAT